MKTFTRCATLFVMICALLTAAHGAGISSAPGAADKPWKIYQTSAVNYPLLLMNHGVVHGEARVRVSIDAGGKLLDALVVGSSRSAFGDEALRAVKLWRFDPEWVKGEAIGVVADIQFVFDVNGPVAIDKLSPAPNEELYAPEDPFAYRAESLKQLDHIPNPTQLVPPVYPQEWADRGITGTATVEFYIDETGRARIPLVTAADHRFLAASAVAAVAQWKFEPPTRGGKPALVRAEQVFTFQPTKK